MPCCVVPTCKNAGGPTKKQEGITFHVFPADEKRKSDWANIIKRARLDDLWKPSKRSVVCSIHFDEKYFYVSKAGLRRLKKEAFPKKRLALDNSESCRSGSLTPKHVTTLRQSSPPLGSEIGDVDISDLESVFDSPQTIKLKSLLRRKEMFCKRNVRRLKTLQQKHKRLAKRNETLKNILKNLKNKSYRSSLRGYSTEEKPVETEAEKPATIEECHKQIDSLTNELNTFKAQVKDYEDKYKRALADGENVRRRMMKQVEDAKSFAIQSFCKDLLDVADTLSAAAESAPEGEAGGPALRALADGVKLTRAQLNQVFNRHGLVAVSPLREKFDPNLHEALFQQEVEGAESGTVVAVSKIGYKLRERCVRPALVGVAK